MAKQQLINYFIELLKVLKTKTSPDYPDSIFYLYKNKVYIQYNQKQNIAWLDYDKIWFVFGSQLSFNYMEIREITDNMVKEYLKLKVLTSTAPSVSLSVEEHLKLIKNK